MYTKENSQRNTVNNVKYFIYFQSILTQFGTWIKQHICNKMVSKHKVKLQNNT